MWRGRLTARHQRVLAVVEQAHRDGSAPLSGFAVFQRLSDASSRTGSANHGRVFAALRTLTARGYLEVRFAESAAGPTALYTLAPAGQAHLDARGR